MHGWFWNGKIRDQLSQRRRLLHLRKRFQNPERLQSTGQVAIRHA
jgi:hypothetical protein